ncbi:Y-family DNA polymerase [Streptococcus suis]|uniref:Y-family DNA polymerase n=1 Tax=Streptococcus TaxID=1301 RepID=UPI0014325A95|nr:Y-family DNA polymerase [Streptococcus suis]MBY4977243.1 Y-family DNA polymerase [Streptococcus suis]NJW38566.1 Y-family DNA polymerase [Streptococcus suis]
MGYIDYSKEPRSDIAFVDMKSFYASIECVDRGLHPLYTSLCVMSRADHASGLILAASPMFKQVFGKGNVGRSYDLPFDINTRKFSYQNAWKQGIEVTPKYKSFIEHWAKRTLIVAPRMERYIEKNLEIQHIFQDYAAPDDIHPYSIDEGFIDLTSSLRYFIPGDKLSRKDKLDNVSALIQRDIFRKTGVISTVGMSNANPLLAKLALDNEAKKTPTMRANWSYEDVETKVWAIPNLTDFWGIGDKREKRLRKLGVNSIKELANFNPDVLKKELGKEGVQLWFHANGVDESDVHEHYKPKSRGLGNSQMLPRDYRTQREIEVALAEMADQVANRLRQAHKKATVVSIHIGFSWTEKRKSINAQKKIDPANLPRTMVNHVLELFRSKYSYGIVRQIGVTYSGFVDENLTLLSLFDDLETIEKEEKIQTAIDAVREKFGFLAIQKGTVLTEGSRNIERSKLIGGHSAGGLEGLK